MVQTLWFDAYNDVTDPITFTLYCPSCEIALCTMDDNARFSLGSTERYIYQQYLFSAADNIPVTIDEKFCNIRVAARLFLGICEKCHRHHYAIQITTQGLPLNRTEDEIPHFISSLVNDDHICFSGKVYSIKPRTEMPPWTDGWLMMERVNSYAGRPVTVYEHWIGTIAASSKDVEEIISQWDKSDESFVYFNEDLLHYNDMLDRAKSFVEGVLPRVLDIALTAWLSENKPRSRKPKTEKLTATVNNEKACEFDSVNKLDNELSLPLSPNEENSKTNGYDWPRNGLNTKRGTDPMANRPFSYRQIAVVVGIAILVVFVLATRRMDSANEQLIRKQPSLATLSNVKAIELPSPSNMSVSIDASHSEVDSITNDEALEMMNSEKGSTYLINYQISWLTKYRKEFITEEMMDAADTVLRAIAEKHDWQLRSVDIQADEINLSVITTPDVSPAEVVKIFKEESQRRLLKKFPDLEKVSDGKLWASTYCITTGAATAQAVMEQYNKRNKGFRLCVD